MRCERLHGIIRKIPGTCFGNEEYLTDPEFVPGFDGIKIQLASLKQNLGELPAGVYVETNIKKKGYSKEVLKKFITGISLYLSDKLIGRRPGFKQDGSPLLSTDSLFFYPDYQTKDGRLVIKLEDYLPSEFERKHREPECLQIC